MTTDVYPRENCKLRVLIITLYREKKRTFAVELKAGVWGLKSTIYHPKVLRVYRVGSIEPFVV